MEKLVKAGGVFYALGVVAIGIQQFFYAEFRPVIFPQWPFHIPLLVFWVYFIGLVIVGAGLAVIFEMKALTAALLLGGLFLFLFLFGQLPFQIFYNPYSKYFGSWTDPIKELAMSGGAFVIAGSFLSIKPTGQIASPLSRFLIKIIPLGRIFFSVMLISFGIDHFLYVSVVTDMVPVWIPLHVFWTYFAGIALVGSGLAILFNIRLRTVSLLTGIMIFLWLLVLHIPRAIADPYGAKGNEVTSVFEALAFSGIAFVLAGRWQKKK